MKPILISHESPNQLLQASLKYNDYTYILVHLMAQNNAYRDFHLNLAKLPKHKRPQLMLDNSIFELGHAFDEEKYINWYTILNPDFIIIPDVLENYKQTCNKFTSFVEKYNNVLHKDCYKVGVVQGKTYEELCDCYQFMSEHADYIAISFDYSYYLNVYKTGNITKYEAYTIGRQSLITQFIDDCIWNENKPHHLLGASLAREFSFYRERNITNIRSVDTSNPIVAGLLGYTYTGDLGLKNYKPSIKLADMIDYKVDMVQYERIMYNVEQFRKIVNF